MKRRLSQIVLFLLCAVCILGTMPAARAEGTDFSAWGVFDFALVSGTDKLNLRTGPGTEYQWIGAVNEGGWVGIVGENNGWYRVYVAETNQYGYMSKNFLKRAGNITPPGSNTGVVSNPKPTQFLNLRAYPSYDAQVLGIYYNGAAFTLLSSTPDGWYQVLINGQVGYFRSEYVRLTGSDGTGETAIVRSGNGGKVVWDNLTPNTEYDVYARMKETSTQKPSPAAGPAAVTTPKDTLTLTKPQANALTYNGQPQALVTAASVTAKVSTLNPQESGVRIEYRLDNGEWSETIPTAKDAGTYTL